MLSLLFRCVTSQKIEPADHLCLPNRTTDAILIEGALVEPVRIEQATAHGFNPLNNCCIANSSVMQIWEPSRYDGAEKIRQGRSSRRKLVNLQLVRLIERTFQDPQHVLIENEVSQLNNTLPLGNAVMGIEYSVRSLTSFRQKLQLLHFVLP